MMNRSFVAACAAALVGTGLASQAALGGSLVYEQEREFFGTGDFDGDGRQDAVIVDRASGKIRLGYQSTPGTFTWVNYRVSGVKDVTGVAVGKLVSEKADALAFTAANGNLVTVVDAANPKLSVKPAPVPFQALGPNGAAAAHVGGAGASKLDDLYINSMYDDPNKVVLLRNGDGTFEVASEIETKEQLNRANRLVVKAGGPELVIGLWSTDEGDTFRAEDVSSGKPVTQFEVKGLAKGSEYAIGQFSGEGSVDLLFYKRGENGLQVNSAKVAGGKWQVGEARKLDLGKPLRLVLPLAGASRSQMLVLYGKGDAVEILQFDGKSEPKPVQTVALKQGELCFGAAVFEQQLAVYTAPDYSKFATHYAFYQFGGATNALGGFGKLASMADSDDATVPDIHKHIVETLQKEGVKGQADMKQYTNAIPGTQVIYDMMPIPGGEFTMGSPDAESGRGKDEGPQQKIKISPFWMGKFEVTWNEYEIFMFPDDEKKLRETFPSEDYVNKVSDAVTRPSKPYMEMSFGMGKDGYPAISMTQHAANKYCHWLSAKTGHFYRLPTEAEWEYACRAGTTTAYSFGDDAAKLAEYGWFEQNGDFKYQKVGKKKPNPWGLHDIHGNVWEWCLDQYEPNYDKFVGAMSQNPWNKATTPYPHVVRGGSYDDTPDKLRSAARRASDRSWKMRDPQLPKSIWWLTDAQTVGFRLVRPLNVPPAEELQKYWTSGVERD